MIAALFVGVVAADVFVSMMLRYFFNYLDSRIRTTSGGCCSAS